MYVAHVAQLLPLHWHMYTPGENMYYTTIIIAQYITSVGANY